MRINVCCTDSAGRTEASIRTYRSIWSMIWSMIWSEQHISLDAPLILSSLITIYKYASSAIRLSTCRLKHRLATYILLKPAPVSTLKSA